MYLLRQADEGSQLPDPEDQREIQLGAWRSQRRHGRPAQGIRDLEVRKELSSCT